MIFLGDPKKARPAASVKQAGNGRRFSKGFVPEGGYCLTDPWFFVDNIFSTLPMLSLAVLK